MGGTGRLVAELDALLRRVGVNVVLNTDIASIDLKDGRAIGATTADGTYFAADRVICNGDPPTVYSQMLPAKNAGRKRLMPESMTQYSMGLFVLFFGTRKTYDDIAHHTIWMGPRYKELLADIFDRKILADDFSLYLHRPTATDKSFAPEGCDSFYVLCPVPNLRADIDWNVTGPELQKRIISALSKTNLPDLENVISDPFYMTPEDFKMITGRCMGPVSRLRQFSCSQHGFGFTIVIHTFPIFILPPLVPIRALVFRVFYVRQRWSNAWLQKMKTNRVSPQPLLLRYDFDLII
jgi:phytoene desaturase